MSSHEFCLIREGYIDLYLLIGISNSRVKSKMIKYDKSEIVFRWTE